MNKIWQPIKHHLKNDFRLWSYALVFLLLGVLIVFNYALDFEDEVLDTKTGFRKFAAYFGFYSLPYYLTLLISSRFKEDAFWFKPAFWIKSLFALTILSLDSSVPFLRGYIDSFDIHIQYWLYKVFVNLVSVVIVLLPILVFHYFFDREESTLYGLSWRSFDYKPYVTILAVIIPMLALAFMLDGFRQQYPMYKTSSAHIYLNVPDVVTALGYELAYGLDFVTVEYLFRGFMVIGLIDLTGRKCVLAMAVVYCLLHFGKPAGEAISSIFGGYVLGVIAYQYKNIWGGVLLHVGIAWSMEIIGFVVKYFR